MCSFDLPTACTGRNSADRSSGSFAITVSTMPWPMIVSVETARCGPCCSIAAIGSTAIVFSGIEAGEVLGGELQPVDLAHGQNLTIAARTLAMNALRCSSVATFM